MRKRVLRTGNALLGEFMPEGGVSIGKHEGENISGERRQRRAGVMDLQRKLGNPGSFEEA